MWIWFALSAISLVLGTLIYPWHNLPQDLTRGRSLTNYILFVTLIMCSKAILNLKLFHGKNVVSEITVVEDYSEVQAVLVDILKDKNKISYLRYLLRS